MDVEVGLQWVVWQVNVVVFYNGKVVFDQFFVVYLVVFGSYFDIFSGGYLFVGIEFYEKIGVIMGLQLIFGRRVNDCCYLGIRGQVEL